MNRIKYRREPNDGLVVVTPCTQRLHIVKGKYTNRKPTPAQADAIMYGRGFTRARKR